MVIARLNSALTSLIQATYLGGSGLDYCNALAIHPTTGEVFVAGHTSSADFPGTAGGAQPGFGGSDDAFVARFNAALTTLNQATYVGGNGADAASSIAFRPTTGEVFVSGQTDSSNFPGTVGGAQSAPAGNLDAFVARLNGALTTLNQATYLGGSGNDFGGGLAIHPTTGEVFVAGITDSADFPATAGGAQPSPGGNLDVVVSRLNAGLTKLNQATYLGGSGDDRGGVLAVDTTGDVLTAGMTTSLNFPNTSGGAQPTSGGNYDGFIARLTSDLRAGQVPVTPTLTPTRTATPATQPATPTPTPPAEPAAVVPMLYP